MSTPVFGLLPTIEPAEPGLTHATDHEDRAVGVFIELLRDKARFTQFMKDHIKLLQELEDVFWDLYTKRSIDTAEGVQLDVLGKIVQEKRNGLTDADYRVVLRAKGRVLLSKGTLEDVLAVAGLMLQDVPFSYDEVYPAGFELTVLGVPPFTPGLLVKFLRKTKSAGVRLLVTAAASPNAFRYGDAGAPTTSTAFGYNDGVYGGIL